MNTENEFICLKRQQRILLFWLIAIIQLNIILEFLAPSGQTKDLRDQIVSGWQLRKAVIITIVFSNAILGALLALLLNLIPYRNLPYGKRYTRTFLITVLIIQTITLMFLVKNVLFSFLHHSA